MSRMEQMQAKKIKPCVVKLKRIMEDPEIIRERIITNDQRIRRCHVLLSRVSVNPIGKVATSSQIRRCCVRLPRLNTEVFEILERSSPSVLSDDEEPAEDL